MTSKFYDLEISKLDDGTIRLEQHYGCDESAIIDLHPLQAAFVANGNPANSVAERIATLERRMLWMRDRFDECQAALPMDFYERCGDVLEFDAWLLASIDVSREFCADFHDAPSNATAIPLKASLLPLGDVCLPSVAGSGDGHPEQPSGDLFA